MLELSDYDENEEAHKSSNVECVEVNNGIKMANKRSKSLEKEERKADNARRPDTAPPILPVNQVINSTVAVNKEIVATDATDNKKDDKDSKTESVATWHEHIYRKPPKMPTPYSIMDILQWGSQHQLQQQQQQFKSSDNNNNSSRSYQHVEPSTLQHLLNLNINSPPSTNANNNNNNSHANNGISNRGLSFSETSDEDESVASDQPLNLCVIKSRDSSPGIVDRSINKAATAISSGKMKKDLPTTKSILKRKRSIEVTSDSYLSNDSMSYKESNGKEIDDDEEHSINEDGYDEQSPDGKRKKKARTTFTGRQIFELEKQFEVKKYLSSSERSEMARLLNVTETQVKIWFQNRRTKWKKHENITNAEASEHKTNGSKSTTNQEIDMLSSTKSSSKSVAAELSAKITAKQNSRLKQQQQQHQSNGTKINKHMEPPKLKTHGLSHHNNKGSGEGVVASFHHFDMPPSSYLDKSSMLKSSFHNFHDIESHLSSSKISISDFKPKSNIAAPVALNLKRNYL